MQTNAHRGPQKMPTGSQGCASTHSKFWPMRVFFGCKFGAFFCGFCKIPSQIQNPKTHSCQFCCRAIIEEARKKMPPLAPESQIQISNTKKKFEYNRKFEIQLNFFCPKFWSQCSKFLVKMRVLNIKRRGSKASGSPAARRYESGRRILEN